jgi:hypothetical protein
MPNEIKDLEAISAQFGWKKVLMNQRPAQVSGSAG